MNDYNYHPFEIAFCGLSNSGKTTLISKLIKDLSSQYNVGYLKHDAHFFEMDIKGKDTWHATQNGAKVITINDKDRHNTLREFNAKDIFADYNYMDCDFLILEGYKKSPIPKMVFVDEQGDVFSKLEFKDSVIALIIADKKQITLIPESYAHLPVYYRDDLELIKEHLLKVLTEKSNNLPICGLILAGGKSSRMQEDKSAMIYHGDQTQLEYLHDVLSSKVDKVYISCRVDQKESLPYSKFNIIEDRFIGMGPMGGILSAMSEKRAAKWMVLACDLPLVNKETIDQIIDNADPFKMATAFENSEARRLEPLCTLYSPWAYGRMLQLVAQERYCPQKFLWNAPIKKIDLKKKLNLTNANTPQDKLKIKQILGESHEH